MERNLDGSLRKGTRAKDMRDRAVARLAKAGHKAASIAGTLSLDRTTVYRILNDPRVSEYMDQLDEGLEEELVRLERLAMLVKAKVLSKGLADGASDKALEAADAAATEMLDRAGKRGSVAVQVESKSLSLTGDAAATFIANAQRDPGVQRIIASNPEVKAILAAPAADAQPAS